MFNLTIIDEAWIWVRIKFIYALFQVHREVSWIVPEDPLPFVAPTLCWWVTRFWIRAHSTRRTSRWTVCPFRRRFTEHFICAYNVSSRTRSPNADSLWVYFYYWVMRKCLVIWIQRWCSHCGLISNEWLLSSFLHHDMLTNIIVIYISLVNICLYMFLLCLNKL